MNKSIKNFFFLVSSFYFTGITRKISQLLLCLDKISHYIIYYRLVAIREVVWKKKRFNKSGQSIFPTKSLCRHNKFDRKRSGFCSAVLRFKTDTSGVHGTFKRMELEEFSLNFVFLTNN